MGLADQWSHLSYMRSSPFCHFPCAFNSFQTLFGLCSVLFCSVLFCFPLSLCNFFQHFPVFRWDQRDPKQRSHFPPCTYMLGSRERERERERRLKRGMRLAHTVFYKISFEHSKIWEKKKTSDIMEMSWVLLGSYCPFLEKKGIDWCNPSQMANFLL